jgi:hypothetical protein
VEYNASYDDASERASMLEAEVQRLLTALESSRSYLEQFLVGANPPVRVIVVGLAQIAEQMDNAHIIEEQISELGRLLAERSANTERRDPPVEERIVALRELLRGSPFNTATSGIIAAMNSLGIAVATREHFPKSMDSGPKCTKFVLNSEEAQTDPVLQRMNRNCAAFAADLYQKLQERMPDTTVVVLQVTPALVHARWPS